MNQRKFSHMLTVEYADLFRIGRIKYMINVWPTTTHCVDIARIPCKQYIMSGDLVFLYESNFMPFV